jgi:hypothetical protein
MNCFEGVGGSFKAVQSCDLIKRIELENELNVLNSAILPTVSLLELLE